MYKFVFFNTLINLKCIITVSLENEKEILKSLKNLCTLKLELNLNGKFFF